MIFAEVRYETHEIQETPKGAGEWHQLKPLFPDMNGKDVLDLVVLHYVEDLDGVYHHTLTQILNGLIRTGFSPEAVEEAMPQEEWR